MLALTKQERLVLLFLSGVLCAGTLIRLIFYCVPTLPVTAMFLDERSLLGRVDINTASVEELQGLPGVGAGLAARIVAFRARQGGFLSVEKLREVPGVGEKLFLRISPYLKARRVP